MPLYARLSSDKKRKQLLVDHLHGVADRARQFAEKFGAGDCGWLLGMTHDLAKASPGFQRRLAQSQAGKDPEIAPHAYPSASAMQNLLEELVPCVQGHHSQMRDWEVSRQRLLDEDEEAERAALYQAAELDIPEVQFPAWATEEESTKTEMFVRMCFSCLIDADRLDSEAFDNPDAPHGNYAVPEQYLAKLSQHLESFPLDDRPVTQVRRNVQQACAESASEAPGFYRLTVPTGGGKTLASMRFALEHAVKHGMERVVVAIPFTSIVEQTAAVYERVFAPLEVLAHHSAEPIVTDQEDDDFDERRKNASENWDIPIVVTTNVRLFDSLFGNRPSQCRRLHNLAKAVIVLDEPQSLPAELLEPCLDVLNWLVEHAGSTVVFCTATQPDYSSLPTFAGRLAQAKEIVPTTAEMFDQMSRVTYEHLGELTHAEVAAEVRQFDQVLCIVNSRKDSVEIFNQLNDQNALYLSTLLCADHRRAVLERVKQCLRDNLPIRLISTQVIEAGVDVDFPVVMRAMGPLEAIVQAAGRCNREGRRSEKGRVLIFDLAEGAMPKGPYKSAFGAAKAFVPARLHEIDRPEVQSEYYRRFLGSTSTNRSFACGGMTVQRARERRDFQTVAREAKLIDEDTVSVVTVPYEEARITELLESFLPPKRLFQALGPYSVSIRRREADAHVRAGRIQLHPTGALLWRGNYDRTVGIAAGVVFDPSDLIA